ncbi:MAG: hypothetical protein EOO89_09615 [Pedobacter sp.]|nr:MAG: hypothetical protein EOO89_09615 [Pedobacter sp.]
MKTSLNVILFSVIILLASCKKKETAPEVVEPRKLLTKITQVDFTGTRFTTFSYDDQLRLKVINQYSLTTYFYDGINISAVETATFGNAPINKTTINYSNGRPVKAVVELKEKTRIYGYIYDGDQLSEIHVTEKGIVISILKYKCDNHNITSVSDSDTKSTRTFTYGTNKNVYASVGLDYILGFESIDRYSKNEELEIKVEYPGVSSLEKNVYQYDSQGYPTTKVNTYTSQGSPPSITKYAFEYEMRK